MKPYLIKYYKLFFIAIVFVALEAFCDLMQPSIMSSIIDNGIEKNNINYIIKQGVIMLIITFLGASFALVRNIISTKVSQNFGYDLRNDLFEKINTFSFQTVEKFNKASLITRITNDVSQLQNFSNRMMRVFVKAPILCIGSFIMAIKLNFKMSIILLTIIITVFFIILLNLKIGYSLFKKVQHSIDKLNSKMREYLGGIRIVKNFNRYEYEIDKFNSVNDELYYVSTKAMTVMALFTPMITITVNIGIVVVLYLGILPTFGMKIGVTVAYINYMARMLSSLIMISQIFNVFARAKSSYERTFEVINQYQKEEKDLNIVDSIENIEFINVNFSYDKISEHKVLNNINFKINKGENIGIIGITGSGKTSIINLIPKFYEIDSGDIKINDFNIKDLDDKSLRDKIAIVPQNNNLFSGTIIENIMLGNQNATLEEIEICAKIVKANDFITSFKDGYNTILGRGGINISGGQKQRISIARALVKNPSLLILDDATSALDVRTEADIIENINKYRNDLTYIIISQRISSIIDCDKIIVLEEGEIVGSGNHEDLLKKCEAYKDIFKSQVNRELI